MKTPEIIVALDVPNRVELTAALDRLPLDINWFKVGLELFCAEGPDVLSPIKQRGKRIFLDLKLHDIPRTVEKAVQSNLQHGVELLTVHASGGPAMLKAAVKAAKNSSSESPLRLLAVTVLTSLDQTDMKLIGVERSTQEQALALAKMAYDCGVDGVVCSLHEASLIRASLGPEALIVTPGIRLPGDQVGDQKRVGTPREAMHAGATHLVMGRSILSADNPRAAFQSIVDDLRG